MSALADLKTLLTDTAAHDDAFLTLQVLQVAFAWCAEVVTTDRLVHQSRGDMLTLLAHLSDALRIGRAYLSSTTPSLLERVGAGGRLKEAFEESEAALAQGVQELERLRADVMPLIQQEGALQRQAVERTELENRRGELERLARLAAGTAELRQQVEELDKRLTAARPEVERLEQHIAHRAQRLVVLSEETLTYMEPNVRQALELADDKEKAFHEAKSQLRVAIDRYKQADGSLQELQEVLRLYKDADRAVAQALPGAQTVHNIIDEAERLLQKADQALQVALKANAEAQRLDRISFVGGDA